MEPKKMHGKATTNRGAGYSGRPELKRARVMAGAETWHRILNAIERLQAKAPAEGEKVH
jgi:hypothetical protein